MKIGIWSTSDICYNSLNYFLDCIVDTLNRLGVDTEKFEVLNEEVLYAGFDAFIGINSPLPTDKLTNGQYILDYFNSPFFMIYVDPPYYHHQALNEHINNLHIIVLDREHIEYCERYYKPFKSVKFGYLLGPVEKEISYKDKEIDVLFAGSLYDENEFRQKVRSVWDEDWATGIYDVLVKLGKEEPDISMSTAMKMVLDVNNVECDDEKFQLLMNLIGTCAEFYLRGYYRRKIIKELVDAGITVHVAGNGWENLYQSCPHNLKLLGAVDFEKSGELMANSKIVLNIMPWFKDGLHDRVPTTMWNGSLCITDSSAYIREYFDDMKELVIFKLSEVQKLPQKIAYLLNNPVEAEEIAKAGNKKVKEIYSWERMVKECILGSIEMSI